MHRQIDIERVTCEERTGPITHGPIVRFRIVRNGSPVAGTFDTFEEAERCCKVERYYALYEAHIPKKEDSA